MNLKQKISQITSFASVEVTEESSTLQIFCGMCFGWTGQLKQVGWVGRKSKAVFNDTSPPTFFAAAQVDCRSN